MESSLTVREVLLAEGFTPGCPDLIAVEGWCRLEGLVFDFDLVGLHEVKCFSDENAFSQALTERLMKVFEVSVPDLGQLVGVNLPLALRRLVTECAARLAM